MCGIAGLVMADGSDPDAQVLQRLADALAHRGPDGCGMHIAGGTGLAHRRLAIIDLETGDQPLQGPAGLALAANGEIYNYVELRRELQAFGPFRTASDCEVVMHLYRRQGLDLTSSLRGMYAFALHDAERGRLLLARDPFGIKPLYYIETPRAFAFASEPRALFAAGLAKPATDAARAHELLELNFTTGAETIFPGVRRVLPGELLVVERGRIVERRRQAALPTGAPARISEAEALARLDEVLADSLTLHQRSDVPYGLFLSGGVDSRTILASMARLGTRGVQAYTAAFSEAADRDESAPAAAAAKLFGARHIRVEVGQDDFWAAMPAAVAATDDPMADAAVVPTFILAREAAKDVKVVLSGEGSDEIFAGYSRYRRQSRPLWLGGRKRRRSGPFLGADVLRHEHADWRSGIATAERLARTPGRTRLQVAQATDFADFLPHYLLTKLDRPLMWHGLEGRTPLLDLSVAAFGFQLPDALKLRRGGGKYLLRLWLSRQAPQDDCFSRKKGFTPPYLRWIHERGRTLGPLVAADPAIRELCRPGTVDLVFAADGKRERDMAWRLLYYCLWHRRHIRGLPLDGDVEACLAQGG